MTGFLLLIVNKQMMQPFSLQTPSELSETSSLATFLLKAGEKYHFIHIPVIPA